MIRKSWPGRVLVWASSCFLKCGKYIPDSRTCRVFVLSLIQEDITKAIAGRRCSLVLTPTQEHQMVELITKLLK